VRRLRIVIQSMNYAPELVGIGKYAGEMGTWLAAQGHEVRVVAAPPYYPSWRIQDGYSATRYRREQVAGAQVTRCPLWVPRAPNGIKRLVHLASYAIASAPVMLWEGIRGFDVVIITEPPLFCSPVALIAARLARARTWLHIQDFEVDTAFNLGMLPRSLERPAKAIESFILGRFDRVSTVSDAMLARLGVKGVKPHRHVLLPNWVDTNWIRPMEGPNPLRRMLGIPSEAVVVLYAGNMGAKQGLEDIVNAARLLIDEKNIYFIFCGDGVNRQDLVNLSADLNNIHFLPLRPYEQLNELLNLADIHVLPQRLAATDLVMPSKLTGMLASGRPVVTTALAGSQVAGIVQNCGRVVRPGEPAGLAEALRELAQRPNERHWLGQQARCIAEKYWSKDRVLTELEKTLMELCEQTTEDVSHQDTPFTSSDVSSLRGTK